MAGKEKRGKRIPNILDTTASSTRRSSLKFKCSSRLAFLSLPKKVHKDYQPPRAVPTAISHSAKHAVASHRIAELSLPMERKITPKFEREKPVDIRCPPRKTLISSRLEKLALSKPLHPEFIPGQPTQRPISKAVLNATPSQRILELSKPVIRKMHHIILNPFEVNPATQTVNPTKRILELAKPKNFHSKVNLRFH